MAQITQNVLLYFILPLWLAAGVADWLCHRASNLAQTTGAKESIIHLLMLAEIGVPLLLALFFDINAFVIATMIVAFLVHEATAMWDVSYASSRRAISPIEQHVHSFLELIPLMAMMFVIVLNWSQFLALFGLGPGPANFRLVLKQPPLPTGYVATLLAAVVLLELLPFIEEFWRALRANGGRLVPPGRKAPSPGE